MRFVYFSVNDNYMTTTEAKKFGRTKTLKATAIVLAVLTVLFLFGETKGDFEGH